MSKLTRQRGYKKNILVCPKCLDNPLSFDRDLLIQENLNAGSSREAGVADILSEPMQDTQDLY